MDIKPYIATLFLAAGCATVEKPLHRPHDTQSLEDFLRGTQEPLIIHGPCVRHDGTAMYLHYNCPSPIIYKF